ncbi:MAG: diversity-generating retroelement protein Avd [Acidobacteriota bacterium]|nr:diversity-generating retroelement protein Avd [Acidobacteriota bacterium]
MAKQEELSVIQKSYDLILWYVPVVNRLPRDFKFTLGERIVTGLYEMQEQLIVARYAKKKLTLLEGINTKLDQIRFQTRLLLDFKLIEPSRFAHASKLVNAVGVELGGWIKQQRAILSDAVPRA